MKEWVARLNRRAIGVRPFVRAQQPVYSKTPNRNEEHFAAPGPTDACMTLARPRGTLLCGRTFHSNIL